MTNPVLKITDGTTSINLITPEGQPGIHLDSWLPSASDYKGGGIWRNNSRADGRRLTGKQWANVSEIYDIKINGPGGSDQDPLITTLQDLRRLLEKASDYWTTPQQNEPVWIEARGSCESNIRYSIIVKGKILKDSNSHDQPFFAETAVLDDLELEIERAPLWLAYPPGSGVCVEASGEQEGWEYGDWSQNTAQPALVDAIIELQSVPGRMVAGDSTQVWFTDTGGAVWTLATTNPVGSTGGLVELSNGNIIFSLHTPSSIYRSTDGAVNWSLRANTTFTSMVNDGLVYRASDSKIYLATESLGNEGIWRSGDEGLTWEHVYNVGRKCYSIIVASDGNLYAATTEGGATVHTVIRSENGTTWVQIAQFIEPGGLTDMHLREAADTRFVIVLVSGIFDSRTFVSRDFGQSWYRVGDIGGCATNDIIEANNGLWYAGAIGAACPGHIYQAGVDLEVWTQVADIGLGCYSLLQYSGNQRIYAGGSTDIWVSSPQVDVGNTGTCNDETFFSNKRNVAQLTDIWTYDAAPVTWTSQFPSGGASWPILNVAPAVGDIVYFGIDTTVPDSGPFNNIVFDILDTFLFSAVGYTYEWEYYSSVGPGWVAANVHDETVGFQNNNTLSVHWVPPATWITANLNTLFGGAAPNVTGYWIRMRLTTVPAYSQVPMQGTRDVYTCNWPRIDVDSAQVPGDIPALLRIRAHNRSDEDYYETIDELDLLENRMVVGLRSLDRGSTFISFINLADEQNPIEITVAAGTGSVFTNKIEAPSGRMVTHDTNISGSTGLTDYVDAAIVTLGPSISRDFYGTYQVYLRAQLEESSGIPVADADASVQVRLSVRSGSGGITKTTKHKRFVGWDSNTETYKDWQLLSFGKIDIPVSDLFNSTELPDECQIVVQVSASSLSLFLNINLYDIVLIPVDEWAGDFLDTALEDDSGVGKGNILDLDSVTFPKRKIRALVRSTTSKLIRASYQIITPGPAILQANADQRLWFVSGRAVYLGTHTGGNNESILTDGHADFLRAAANRPGQVTVYNLTDGSQATIGTVTKTTITGTLTGGAGDDWDTDDEYMIICNGIYRSEPWNTHSVQLERNSRYLSFRGDR